MNLITDKDLCEKINVNRMTMVAWRKKGLPHYRIGKLIRYNLTEVLEWMKENCK